MAKKETKTVKGLPALTEPRPVAAPWQKEMLAYTKDAAAATITGGNFLSLKGKRWRHGDVEHGAFINAIIIDYAPVNTYYTGLYDPENPARPECFAIAQVVGNGIDHNDKHLAPGEVPDKQHDTCDGCPQNDWGSSQLRERAKACKNTLRLGMLLVGSGTMEDLTDPSALQLMQLSLPPTSKRNFSKFLSLCASQETNPFELVVQLTFDDKYDYSVVNFKPYAWTPQYFMGVVQSSLTACVKLLTANAWPSTKQNGKRKLSPSAIEDFDRKLGKKPGGEGRARPRFA